MIRVRFAQRGVTVWVQVRGVRARVGTWTHNSPFPLRPTSPDNPRVRRWCAWIEVPSEPHYDSGFRRTSRTYGYTG